MFDQLFTHWNNFICFSNSLGFQKIITIQELRSAYPYLDWVDRKRWPTKPVQDDEDFPAIEAIVMLGEPIRCVFAEIDVVIGFGI